MIDSIAGSNSAEPTGWRRGAVFAFNIILNELIALNNGLKAGSRKVGLANRLSELRVVLTAVFIYQLAELAAHPPPLVSEQYQQFWGSGTFNPWQWGPGKVFIFAGLLDLFDGWIARWSKSESSWGQFIDPFSDKIYFYATTVWIFFFFNQIHPVSWYTLLAELLMLDLLSTYRYWLAFRKARKSGKVVKSGGSKNGGKLKFCVQILAICPFVSVLCPAVAPDTVWISLSNATIYGLGLSVPYTVWGLAIAVPLAVYGTWQKERATQEAKAERVALLARTHPDTSTAASISDEDRVGAV